MKNFGLFLIGLFFLLGCKKDDLSATTVVDAEGNKYKTVVIGNQTWMAENLKTTRFRNGDIIPLRSDSNAWKSSGLAKETAWCYYDNNSSHDDDYGKLYNWYTVVDSRQICPKGWHVPSNEEVEELIVYLSPDVGSFMTAGGKMKSTGTLQAGTGLWHEPNSEATNSTGFTGHPGGVRWEDGGKFNAMGSFGYWFTSTDGDTNIGGMYALSNANGILTRSGMPKRAGGSCRCVKD